MCGNGRKVDPFNEDRDPDLGFQEDYAGSPSRDFGGWVVTGVIVALGLVAFVFVVRYIINH